MASNPEQGYKTNPFWGFFGAGLGLLLVALGVILPPLTLARWCLAGAFVCLTFAAFILFNRFAYRKVATTVVSAILAGAIIWIGWGFRAAPVANALGHSSSPVSVPSVPSFRETSIPAQARTANKPSKSAARPKLLKTPVAASDDPSLTNRALLKPPAHGITPSSPPIINTCPNGICGQVVVGGTVNNNAPPEPKLTASISEVKPTQGATGETKKYKVTIKTDKPTGPPLSFVLIFDGPFSDAQVSTSYRSQIAMRGGPGVSNGNPAFGFSLFDPSVLPADGELYVTVSSDKLLRLIGFSRGY